MVFPIYQVAYDQPMTRTTGIIVLPLHFPMQKAENIYNLLFN
jgi:hypothetical protein